VSKTAVLFFTAPAAESWKRNISSVSEKAFPDFLAILLLLLNSIKRRGVLIHKNSLASCVLPNKAIWVLGHWWVDTPHKHTSEWDSLFLQSCLLSTVTFTPSDLDHVNRSTSLQLFRLIHLTPSRRSRVRFFAFVPRGAFFAFVPRGAGSRRTKSLKTVATRVSRWIVLFCERYWLAGVWCFCHVWWRMLFLKNCFGIELVLCDLYLKRFFLTKGLLSDTFAIFFTNCVVVIIVFLNSNGFQYQWIGKPNQTPKLNAPQTRFYLKKNRCRQDLSWEECAASKNAPQARHFWLNPDGYSVLLM